MGEMQAERFDIAVWVERLELHGLRGTDFRHITHAQTRILLAAVLVEWVVCSRLGVIQRLWEEPPTLARSGSRARSVEGHFLATCSRSHALM